MAWPETDEDKNDLLPQNDAVDFGSDDASIRNFVGPDFVPNQEKSRSSQHVTSLRNNSKRRKEAYDAQSTALRSFGDRVNDGGTWYSDKANFADDAAVFEDVDANFRDGVAGFDNKSRQEYDSIRARHNQASVDFQKAEVERTKGEEADTALNERYFSMEGQRHAAMQRVWDDYHNPSRSSRRKGNPLDAPFKHVPTDYQIFTNTAGAAAARADAAYEQERYRPENRQYFDAHEKLMANGGIVSRNGMSGGFANGMYPQERQILRAVQDGGRQAAVDQFGDVRVSEAEAAERYMRASNNLEHAKWQRIKAEAGSPEDKQEATVSLAVAQKMHDHEVAQRVLSDDLEAVANRHMSPSANQNVDETMADDSWWQKARKFLGDKVKGGAVKERMAREWLWHSTGMTTVDQYMAQSEATQREAAKYGNLTLPSELGATYGSDASLGHKAHETGKFAAGFIADFIGSYGMAYAKVGLPMALGGRGVGQMADQRGMKGMSKFARVFGAYGGIAATSGYLELAEAATIFETTKSSLFPDGVDMTDPASVQAALENKEHMGTVRKASYGRSAIIGAIDMLTAKVGFAVGKKIFPTTSAMRVGGREIPRMGMTGKVAGTGAVWGIDGLLGGGGEVAGQYFVWHTQSERADMGNFATLDRDEKGNWHVGGYMGEHNRIDEVLMEALGGTLIHGAGTVARGVAGKPASAIRDGMRNAMTRVKDTHADTQRRDAVQQAEEAFGKDQMEREMGTPSGSTAFVVREHTGDDGAPINNDGVRQGTLDNGGKEYTYFSFDSHEGMVTHVLDRFKNTDQRTHNMLNEAFQSFRQANPDKFADIKVVFHADDPSAGGLGATEFTEGESRQGAYDPKNNVLYINTNPDTPGGAANYGAKRGVTDSAPVVEDGEFTGFTQTKNKYGLGELLIHEAGHFAEAFAVSEGNSTVIADSFVSMNDAVVDGDGKGVGQFVAWLHYVGDASHPFNISKANANYGETRDAFYHQLANDSNFKDTVQSEWFSYQMARHLRGKRTGQATGLAGIIEDTVNMFEPVLKGMVGEDVVAESSLEEVFANLFDPNAQTVHDIPTAVQAAVAAGAHDAGEPETQTPETQTPVQQELPLDSNPPSLSSDWPGGGLKAGAFHAASEGDTLYTKKGEAFIVKVVDGVKQVENDSVLIADPLETPLWTSPPETTWETYRAQNPDLTDADITQLWETQTPETQTPETQTPETETPEPQAPRVLPRAQTYIDNLAGKGITVPIEELKTQDYRGDVVISKDAVRTWYNDFEKTRKKDEADAAKVQQKEDKLVANIKKQFDSERNKDQLGTFEDFDKAVRARVETMSPGKAITETVKESKQAAKAARDAAADAYTKAQEAEAAKEAEEAKKAEEAGARKKWEETEGQQDLPGLDIEETQAPKKEKPAEVVKTEEVSTTQDELDFTGPDTRPLGQQELGLDIEETQAPTTTEAEVPATATPEVVETQSTEQTEMDFEAKPPTPEVTGPRVSVKAEKFAEEKKIDIQQAIKDGELNTKNVNISTLKKLIKKREKDAKAAAGPRIAKTAEIFAEEKKIDIQQAIKDGELTQKLINQTHIKELITKRKTAEEKAQRDANRLAKAKAKAGDTKETLKAFQQQVESPNKIPDAKVFKSKEGYVDPDTGKTHAQEQREIFIIPHFKGTAESRSEQYEAWMEAHQLNDVDPGNLVHAMSVNGEMVWQNSLDYAKDLEAQQAAEEQQSRARVMADPVASADIAVPDVITGKIKVPAMTAEPTAEQKKAGLTKLDVRMAELGEWQRQHAPPGYDFTNQEVADALGLHRTTTDKALNDALKETYTKLKKAGVDISFVREYFARGGGGRLGSKSLAHTVPTAWENDILTTLNQLLYPPTDKSILRRGKGGPGYVGHNAKNAGRIMREVVAATERSLARAATFPVRSGSRPSFDGPWNPSDTKFEHAKMGITHADGAEIARHLTAPLEMIMRQPWGKFHNVELPVQSAVPKTLGSELANMWRELTVDDAIFRFGRPEKTSIIGAVGREHRSRRALFRSLEDITKSMNAAVGNKFDLVEVRKPDRSDEAKPLTQWLNFSLIDNNTGEQGDFELQRVQHHMVGLTVEGKKGSKRPIWEMQSWSNTPAKGGAGALAHQIILEWAAQNQLTIAARGLTRINSHTRKISHYISSILRNNGDTDHLMVAPEMGVSWVQGNHSFNLASLLTAEMGKTFETFPGLAQLSFDFANGNYLDPEGGWIGPNPHFQFERIANETLRNPNMPQSSLDAWVEEGVVDEYDIPAGGTYKEMTDKVRELGSSTPESPFGNAFGVGLTTAKRAVITKTMLTELIDRRLPKVQSTPRNLLYGKQLGGYTTVNLVANEGGSKQLPTTPQQTYRKNLTEGDHKLLGGKIFNDRSVNDAIKVVTMFDNLMARTSGTSALRRGQIGDTRALYNPFSLNPEVRDKLHKRKIRKLDPENQKRIADAFDEMEHAPGDKKVRRAYDAAVRESGVQYEAMIKFGYKVEVYQGKGEPYANSAEMINDLEDNKHFYVLSTVKDFGETPITAKQRAENPFLQDSGQTDVNGVPLLHNDLFRVVHDYFGHGIRGNSFGAIGEENAWDAHSMMFSRDARRAMTTETRGQNSWFNFGKHMRRADGTIPSPKDADYVSMADRSFADQKMGLLPDWVVFQDVEATLGSKPLGLQKAPTRTPDFHENGVVGEIFNKWFGNSVSRDTDGTPQQVYAVAPRDKGVRREGIGYIFGGSEEFLAERLNYIDAGTVVDMQEMDAVHRSHFSGRTYERVSAGYVKMDNPLYMGQDAAVIGDTASFLNWLNTHAVMDKPTTNQHVYDVGAVHALATNTTMGVPMTPFIARSEYNALVKEIALMPQTAPEMVMDKPARKAKGKGGKHAYPAERSEGGAGPTFFQGWTSGEDTRWNAVQTFLKARGIDGLVLASNTSTHPSALTYVAFDPDQFSSISAETPTTNRTDYRDVALHASKIDSAPVAILENIADENIRMELDALASKQWEPDSLLGSKVLPTSFLAGQSYAISKESQLDAVYMEAVERGDTAVAESMVADAAKRATENIKSADPITYDDDGNVIPLSQRFDLTTPDIRYSKSLVNLSNMYDAFGTDSDSHPGVRTVISNLRGLDRKFALSSMARFKKVVDAFNELPTDSDYVLAAKMGEIKKGWYARAAKAIDKLFGSEDAAIFVQILAATSPRVSVQKNLELALHTWQMYLDSGRNPELGTIKVARRHTAKTIRETPQTIIMRKTIAGERPTILENKVGDPMLNTRGQPVYADHYGVKFMEQLVPFLPAHLNNASRAMIFGGLNIAQQRGKRNKKLTQGALNQFGDMRRMGIDSLTEGVLGGKIGDVKALDEMAKLSGFKVESFHRNLMGALEHATNDVWMANFGGILQKVFGDKEPYLASKIKMASVARKMGWEIAEVQETVWSFFKTLTEVAKGDFHGVLETHLAATPEFYDLLTDPQYEDIQKSLKELGLDATGYADNEYAQRVAQAKEASVSLGVGKASKASIKRIEGRAASPATIVKESADGLQETILSSKPLGRLFEDNWHAGTSRVSQTFSILRNDALAWSERLKQASRKLTDPLRVYAQDYMLPVKRLIEEVENTQGNAALPDSQQAYVMQNLSYGKTGSDLVDIQYEHERPISEAVVDRNMDVDVLDEYLVLRFAEERNKHVYDLTTQWTARIPGRDDQVFSGMKREKNAIEAVTRYDVAYTNKSNKQSVKQYADRAKADDFANQNNGIITKVTIGTVTRSGNDKGVGITTAEAHARLQQLGQTHNITDYEHVAKMVDKLNLWALKQKLKFQLISQQDFDRMHAKYKKYVPLRGYESEVGDYQDPDAAYSRNGLPTGKGQNTIHYRTKSATGLVPSDNLPKNALAWSLSLARQTAIEARKNEVMLSFHEMITKAQKFASMKGLKDDKGNLKEWFRFVQIPMNKQTIVQADGNAIVREVPDPSWKDNPNILGVRVKGKTVAMHLKSDLYDGQSSVARALRNGGQQEIGTGFKIMQRAIRYLATINTTLNPEFVVSNFTRDYQTAFLASQALETEQTSAAGKARLKTLHREVAKEAFSPSRLAKVVSGIYLEVNRGRSKLETLHAGTGEVQHWRDMFKRYEKSGGRIFFFGLDDVDTQAKRFANEVDPKKVDYLKYVKTVGQFMEYSNAAVENSVRLSVFTSMVDRGISDQQAAIISRDLTVNFNRKGEAAPFLNSMYLFFNASLQGSTRLLSMTAKSGKMRGMIGGIVLGGFLTAMMNRMAGGEDEDGELYWDQITDWDKHHNMNFLFGGKQYKIPLPYGFNVPFAMGTAIADGMLGGKPAGETLASMAFTAANAFNPIGSTANLWTTLTPTMLRPATELMLNTDYAGRPIYKEQKYDPFLPDHTQYFANTPEHFKKFTSGVNKFFKGDDHRAGEFMGMDMSLSPDVIEHVFDTATGGAGTFVERVAGLTAKAVTPGGKKITPRDIPFARRFYTGEPNWYDQNAYYQLRTHVRISKPRQIEAMRARSPDLAAIKAYERPRLKLAHMIKGTDNQLGFIKRSIAMVEAKRNMTDEQKEVKIEQLRRKRKKIILKVLKTAKQYGVHDY
jgi:hypothetical protein